MQRVKFIYNPSSGESIVADNLDEIIALYQARGFSIIPYRLSFEGSPDDIIYDLDHTFHHILIAGGDGTVNYVVNLLKNNDIDIPIAVLPTGTANDFASILNIPSDIIRACKRILSGDIQSIDLGKVNDQYFVNVFSCGLFTDVSQRTPTILKNTFGKLAYYVGGLGELPKFRKMHITINSDDGSYDGSSLIFFVFNGQTAGKFKIAYNSQIDDGKLDVLIIKGDDPLATVQTIFHYISLLRKKSSYPPGVVHFQCSHLEARSHVNESTDIDGQAGPSFPLSFSCEAGALRVIVPKKR